jgi:hypothetical protein
VIDQHVKELSQTPYVIAAGAEITAGQISYVAEVHKPEDIAKVKFKLPQTLDGHPVLLIIEPGLGSPTIQAEKKYIQALKKVPYVDLADLLDLDERENHNRTFQVMTLKHDKIGEIVAQAPTPPQGNSLIIITSPYYYTPPRTPEEIAQQKLNVIATQQAQAVRERHLQELMAIPHVDNVAIHFADGQIWLLLQTGDPNQVAAIKALAPKQVEGYPILVEPVPVAEFQ